MTPQIFQLRTSDGQELSATKFPADAPTHVLVIGSALGVPRRFYVKMATYFATEKGITVYTLDNRGIGDSRPASLKGYKGSMSDWGRYDLRALLQQVETEHPQLPMVYMGHSAGGQLTAFAPEIHRAERLLLVNTGVGAVSNWPWWQAIFFKLILNGLIPAATSIWGYYPGKKLRVLDDMPGEVAREWAYWANSPDYLFSHHFDTEIEKYTGDVLSIGFSDDLMAPNKARAALLAYHKTAPCTHLQLAPANIGAKKAGHFGAFRSMGQKHFWPVVADWLTGATPSEALIPHFSLQGPAVQRFSVTPKS